MSDLIKILKSSCAGIILCAGAMLAAPAAMAAPAAAASPASPWCAAGKPVKFAGLNWESGSLLTELMRTVMELGYGCKTDSMPGNTVAMEAALAANDIQVLAEEWIGRSDAWNDAFKAGKVIPLGKVIVGASEGWYVPEYVVKGDAVRNIKPLAPDLKSVADLPKYKAVFKDPEEPSKGRFLNCPSGWTCEGINSQKLKAYGLTADYINFRPGTGPALDAAITSEYRRGKPLLFYYWAPTPLMGRFKFIKLQEPAYNEACFKTLADKNQSKPCGSAAPEAVIRAGVSKAFGDGDPVLRGFLEKFSVPLDLLNATLAEMSEQKTGARQVAQAFLKQHPEILKQWVAADVAAKVTAGLR
ncbi:MAG TPA: ABC transporter substrate-binding protein [Herbaspirillum sp.]|jgi:glycine betaine/proline transport system substrate-binding protein